MGACGIDLQLHRRHLHLHLRHPLLCRLRRMLHVAASLSPFLPLQCDGGPWPQEVNDQDQDQRWWQWPHRGWMAWLTMILNEMNE